MFVIVRNYKYFLVESGVFSCTLADAKEFPTYEKARQAIERVGDAVRMKTDMEKGE